MIKAVVMFLIDAYRLLFSFDRGLFSFMSPGVVCKYEVSCSLYTKKMVEKYGVASGVGLGLKRIWSCR